MTWASWSVDSLFDIQIKRIPGTSASCSNLLQ